MTSYLQAQLDAKANVESLGELATLTATEAAAVLPVFTSGAKGLVPASGGGTTVFLRADGSFVSPTISGSITQAQALTVASLRI